MPYSVANAGFTATTSGQTTITCSLIDDAEQIGIYMPSTISTGTSYTVTVCPTSTGSVFFPININQNSTTAMVAMTLTSSNAYFSVEPVTFRQLRVTASAAETTFGSWIVTKKHFV